MSLPAIQESKPQPADGRGRLGFGWFCGVEGAPEPPVVDLLARLAPNALVDRSGRPWVFGAWRPAEIRRVVTSEREALLFGSCCFAEKDARVALDCPDLAEAARRVAQLPGNFHLLLRGDRETYAAGAISGFRRLYFADVGQEVAYSSHAVVLARLTGSGVDDDWLATWLAAPGLRCALDLRSPFSRVRTVRPDHWLVIRGLSEVSSERYWTVPEGDLPLSRSAPRLGGRLENAVGSRVALAESVTADLSGGLDSTALAFLAARALRATNRRLATFFRPPFSPMNDDWSWATRAAGLLPDMRHVSISPETYPVPYSDLQLPASLNEPDPELFQLAELGTLAALLTDEQSDLHLSGFGADQVLEATIAHLVSLLRIGPVRGLKAATGFQALYPLRPAHWRDMLHPGLLDDWLRAAAQSLAGGRPPARTWAGPPDPAHWLSEITRERARSVLEQAAETLEPLGGLAHHVDVEHVWTSSAAHRTFCDVMAAMGVRVDPVFLDNDILELSLSTAGWERIDPNVAKPLLAEAMRGIVPDSLRTRTTKGTYETELHRGWRRNRARVMALFESSRLGDRGLIDVDKLSSTSGRDVTTEGLRQVNRTLAAEMWLRSLEGLASLP